MTSMQRFEAWLGQADRHFRQTGRPLVSLCFAQSLDGSLAAEPGAPLKISGPQSHYVTHRLRALHDAILIGSGTLLADNPRLTARLAGGPHPQPVVLDSRLRTPLNANLIAAPVRPAWIATTAAADAGQRRALEAAGALMLPLPTDAHGRVALEPLLICLGERGVRRLMVEGGAQVLNAFLSAGLADLVSVTIAPLWVGGLNALAAPLPQLTRLKEVVYETAGDDLIVWGRLRDF